MGADDYYTLEECAELMAAVVRQFEGVRTAAATLRRAVSHMMRIYWLANHTTGASWDTVAQLLFREDWDRRMASVTDGYTPIQSWDEKVATAMRVCKQDRHLSKEGTPFGPVCPRLQRKHPQAAARGALAARGRNSSRSQSRRGGGGAGARGKGSTRSTQ